MNPETLSEIVDLLTPLMGDDSARRALFSLALGDHSIIHRIDYEGDATSFTVNAVTVLHNYGQISEFDPRQALWVLLQSAMDQVGAEDQKRIRALEPVINNPYPPDLVFVSYARANGDFARKLVADLDAAGISAWIDKRGLKPGTPDWEQALRGAIRAARVVLLIASPESRQSSYVSDELAIAEMYRKAIIPIWAAGAEWIDSISLGKGKTQYLDLRENHYQEGLQSLLQALRGERTPSAAISRIESAPLPPNFTPRNPYKGLRAFRAEDAPDFFGRDGLIAALIERINHPAGQGRLLAVVGASGSGKSSVVMAGVLPALRREHADWVFLPVMVPGSRPLESLSVALNQVKGGAITDTLKDFELPQARGLHLLAEGIRPKPGSRVVLVVDQFEELFTQTTNEGERQKFIDLLTTAVMEPNGALSLLLTLRADFYDRPMNYPDLGRLIKDHTEVVLPLALNDLYSAIEAPARLDDVRLQFDPGLVAELVFEVRDQAGALPLLQFTLDQLFQRREGVKLTYTAYQDMGGVRGALAKHAESTYQNLPTEEHRRLAQALFLRLIEPGATEQDTTRRRAALGELILSDPKQSAIMSATAEAFTQARLLITNRVGEAETIEVSHEALIRQWERLRDWLSRGREEVRFQRQINADAAEWVRRGRRPDDDGLYRGSYLLDGQQWARRNIPSGDEAAFLAASQTRQTEREAHDVLIARRVRNFRRASVGLGAMVALVILVAILLYRGLAQVSANMVNFALTYAVESERMLTAEARGTVAQVELEDAARTLTPIPPTLTAVAHKILEGEGRIESLRLSSAASTLLNSPSGNAETAALLGIRALRTGYTEQADALVVRAADALATQKLIPVSEGGAATAQLLSDGRFIAWGYDGSLRLWDAQGENVRLMEGNQGSIGGVLELSNKRLLTWDTSGQFVIWSSGGALVQKIEAHENGVLGVLPFADGRLLSWGVDGLLRLWSGAVTPLMTLTGHTNMVLGAHVLKGGRIVSWGEDGTLRWWSDQGVSLRVVSSESGVVGGVLALKDGRSLSWEDDFTLRLWSEDGDLIKKLAGHTDFVIGAVELGDGQLVSWSWDYSLRLWSPEGDFKRALEGHRSWINRVVVLPAGGFLSTSEDQTVRLWNAEGSTLRVLSGHQAMVWDALVLSDRRILSWSEDGTLRLWDSLGSPIRVLSGHLGGVVGALELPNGHILSWSSDNTLRLWDLNSGGFQMRDTAEGSVNGVQLLPDGGWISFSGNNLHLWRSDGLLLKTLSAHTEPVQSVLILPDGRFLSRSTDLTLRLWSASGVLLTDLIGHEDDIGGMLVTSANRIISWGKDMTLRLWSAEGSPLKVLKGHTRAINGAILLPDDRILSWSADSTLRLWSAEGEPLSTFNGHTEPVFGALPLSDGRILSWSQDATLRLWSPEGSPLKTLQGHENPVFSALILPDGRILTTANESRLILWSSEGDLLHRLEQHTDLVTGVRVLKDGRILSWSSDKTLQLWSDQGDPLVTLRGHGADVSGALILSSGQFLSWSADSTLRLWSEQGALVRVLSGHTDRVWGVRELPDGRLISWGADGTIRLWEVTSQDLIGQVCGRVFHDLTSEERQRFGIADTIPTCPQFGTPDNPFLTPTPAP